MVLNSGLSALNSNLIGVEAKLKEKAFCFVSRDASTKYNVKLNRETIGKGYGCCLCFANDNVFIVRFISDQPCVVSKIFGTATLNVTYKSDGIYEFSFSGTVWDGITVIG